MKLSEKKTLTVVDDCGGVLLRFKNDHSGRDLVMFPGNFAVRYSSGQVRTFDKFVTDFSLSGDTGREDILSSEVVEKIQCSRFFPVANKDGMKQLFTSRSVEMFTGVKNDTPANQRNLWVQVRVSIRDWNERARENVIFVSIEIELPKRYVDEF
ncbi:MAG: hypothetical protein EA392_02940 [Cryomorphaceae bacterium]|nr:MAG: hypothetical protein EA392_02940 [Cryomorphaceae bacterium]